MDKVAFPRKGENFQMTFCLGPTRARWHRQVILGRLISFLWLPTSKAEKGRPQLHHGSLPQLGGPQISAHNGWQGCEFGSETARSARIIFPRWACPESRADVSYCRSTVSGIDTPGGVNYRARRGVPRDQGNLCQGSHRHGKHGRLCTMAKVYRVVGLAQSWVLHRRSCICKLFGCNDNSFFFSPKLA